MIKPGSYEIPSWAIAILFWRKVQDVESQVRVRRPKSRSRRRGMSVNKLRRWKGLAVMAIVVLGIVLAASSPSQARKEGGGGHPGGWFAHHDVHDHFGHERAGFGFGGALPYYPYYGYYPYYPPYDPIPYGYQAPVYCGITARVTGRTTRA
jgi:hypothetical protein